MKRWAVLFGVLVLGIVLAADFGLIRFTRQLRVIPLADKIGHFLVFGFLNLLIVRANQQTHPGWGKVRTAAACSLVLVAVAGLEECSQRYIGGRTFSAWDFAASAAGITAFGLAAALWPQSRVRNQKKRVRDRRA
jgi:VanZ family protein